MKNQKVAYSLDLLTGYNPPRLYSEYDPVSVGESDMAHVSPDARKVLLDGVSCCSWVCPQTLNSAKSSLTQHKCSNSVCFTLFFCILVCPVFPSATLSHSNRYSASHSRPSFHTQSSSHILGRDARHSKGEGKLSTCENLALTLPQTVSGEIVS